MANKIDRCLWKIDLFNPNFDLFNCRIRENYPIEYFYFHGNLLPKDIYNLSLRYRVKATKLSTECQHWVA